MLETAERRAQSRDGCRRRAGRQREQPLHRSVQRRQRQIGFPLDAGGRRAAFHALVELLVRFDRETIELPRIAERLAVPHRIGKQRDHAALLHHCRLDRAAIARRRGGGEMHLAPLDRELHAFTAPVAGDVTKRHTQDVEREPDGEIAARGGGDAARHQALGLENISRLLDARRHIGTHVIDDGPALEADELIIPIVDAERVAAGLQSSRHCR